MKIDALIEKIYQLVRPVADELKYEIYHIEYVKENGEYINLKKVNSWGGWIDEDVIYATVGVDGENGLLNDAYKRDEQKEGFSMAFRAPKTGLISLTFNGDTRLRQASPTNPNKNGDVTLKVTLNGEKISKTYILNNDGSPIDINNEEIKVNKGDYIRVETFINFIGPAATKASVHVSPVIEYIEESIEEVKEEIVEEKIPFEIKKVKDSNLPLGEEKIKQEGKEGIKEITYKVTYVDGKETTREKIKEEVTKEPIDKIILVGTKEVKEEIVEEKIPFEIKKIDDPNLELGKEKVKEKGEEGIKEVTYKVTYVDGKEISREKVKEEVTKEPIDKIILVGTKENELPIEDGWFVEDEDWYYYIDGEKVTDKWLFVEVDLDDDGIADKKNWKYFNEEGKNQTTFYIEKETGDVWLSQIGPNEEYLRGWWTNEIGMKYYFRESSGRRVEGFQYIEDSWRYFRTSGTMVTGWQYIDKGWRFFREDGSQVRDKWVWLGVDTDMDGNIDKHNWKYFDKTGLNIDLFYIDNGNIWLSQAGPNKEYLRGWWTNEAGMKYYFRESSGMRVEGWQFIEGSWRYFRTTSGTMVTGKQFIDNKWYNFRKDGSLIGNR